MCSLEPVFRSIQMSPSDTNSERVESESRPMEITNGTIRIDLRIPGNWSHPSELLDRMPNGFRLTPEGLITPDGTKIECAPMPPDNQFAEIFRSSCRRPATIDEMKVVNSYSANVVLSGPGGSLDAALATIRAGAAIVQAGGAGVFIDNCGLAHGGSDWIEMAEDGSPDALSFAFVSIVRGKKEVWTMGMHTLGFRDLIVRRADLDEDGQEIIEMIQYLCGSAHPVGNGDLLADKRGPRFRAEITTGDEFHSESPMHNPFGRLRLVSLKGIAEQN